MSDIAEFVAKNFRSLQPSDYLLLAVFAALVGAALFVAFKSLYAARFAAQRELLELHAQKAGLLADRLQTMQQERSELEDALQRAKQALSAQTSPDSSVAAAGLSAGILEMAFTIVLVYERLVIAHEYLATARRLAPELSLSNLQSAAEQLTAKATQVSEALHLVVIGPRADNADALLRALSAPEIHSLMSAVRDEATTLGAKLASALEA